jgi:hypothetical protein
MRSVPNKISQIFEEAQIEIYTGIPPVSTEPDFCLATLRLVAPNSPYRPYPQNFAIASIKETAAYEQPPFRWIRIFRSKTIGSLALFN